MLRPVGLHDSFLSHDLLITKVILVITLEIRMRDTCVRTNAEPTEKYQDDEIITKVKGLTDIRPI